MIKIYSPVKDFNGWRNAVRFTNGVGVTDDHSVLPWFKSHGYKVPMSDEATLDAVLENPPVVDTSEIDFEAMSPNDLREWMREHGYAGKIKNTRNKEKLLEILRGE